MTAPRAYEARAGLDLRLVRAAVFTAACVTLSAAGHGLASGAAVPLWTLAAAFAGVLGVVVPLAGRQRSLAGISAVLAAGQIALHTLFGLGQHTMAMATSTSMPMPASMPMSMPMRMPMPMPPGETATTVVHGGMAAPPAPWADGSLPGAGTLPVLHALPMLPMLLGHVLASVAAGWLLRRGDLAVFRLLALSAARGVAEAALVRALRAALVLVHALWAGLPGARHPYPRPRRSTAPPAPVRPAAALQHSVIRRGPPVRSVRVLGA